MATFGVSVKGEQLQHHGNTQYPIVVYLMDNSAVTIAVLETTTIEEAVKLVAKRVGLPKALAETFGLYMSNDGSNINQRGLADDLIMVMNDQCMKIVFAPSLMVQSLLGKNDAIHHPVVTKLLFSQVMHDFVIDNYNAINYEQSVHLASLCIYAKYGPIAATKRTFKFLNPRLFEFLPTRFIMPSQKSSGRTTKQTIQLIWKDYNEHVGLNLNKVNAMYAAIQYARSIPEVEHVFVCSNSIAQCRQQILSRFKSRCLIGVGYDGLRLFSASNTNPGLRKFYPMNVITKWGHSESTGQLYFEITVDSDGKSNRMLRSLSKRGRTSSTSSTGSMGSTGSTGSMLESGNGPETKKKKKVKTQGKYIETTRAADICDTLSDYARYRVKEKVDDKGTNFKRTTSSPRVLRSGSSHSRSGSFNKVDTAANQASKKKRTRRSSTMVFKEHKDKTTHQFNSINPNFNPSNTRRQTRKTYSPYAHYVCIMLQALWRGYTERIAFDYRIDKLIQGLESDDEEEAERDQQEQEEEERWKEKQCHQEEEEEEEEEEKEEEKKEDKDEEKTSSRPLPPATIAKLSLDDAACSKPNRKMFRPQKSLSEQAPSPPPGVTKDGEEPIPPSPPTTTPPPPPGVKKRTAQQVTVTTCAVCTQPIDPEQDAVHLNKSQCTIHNTCLNCVECRCTLVNDAQTYVLALDEYRSKGGDPQHSLSDRTVVVPLCKEHFQQRCGSFCIRCSLIIEGPMLKIGEAKYHPACLRCADCDVQVNTEKTGPPKIHNHVIRCGPCFDEVQYDRCMQCNLHIKGQFIRYGKQKMDAGASNAEPKDGKWHPTCFVCASCKIELGGGQTKFIAKEEGIFCSTCYQLANAPQCKACQKPILETSFVRLEGNSYHEKCLACSVCHLPARDADTGQMNVYNTNGVFFCNQHYALDNEKEEEEMRKFLEETE